MNILQVQNHLKDLSDKQLQTQLLNPNGSAPSFLVLSELQRRKDMRQGYAERQASGRSMAEEFARGVGSADVGKYSPAMRAATDPHMTPEMNANPPQPMPGESTLLTHDFGARGYAKGGVVESGSADEAQDKALVRKAMRAHDSQMHGGKHTQLRLASGGLVDFMAGMRWGAPPNRRYLGPGTPSPLGIEQLYFTGSGLDPAIQSIQSIQMAPAASTPMGVGALTPLMDGSANGATGAPGAGSVGAAVGEGGNVSGGDAGTVGAAVGGNAGTDSGTGEDGGGTYADGGIVGDVPESWIWPSLDRYRRMMGIQGQGMPAEPSSRPQWPRIPNWMRSIPEIPPEAEPPMDTPLPRRFQRPYPPQPADYPPAFPVIPGQSPGQAFALTLQGISPEGIPMRAGETGGQPEIYPPPVSRSGSAGPVDPSLLGIGAYQDPGGPDATLPETLPERATAPVSPEGVVDPSVALPGAAGPSGAAGGRPPINIAGPGLQDYINQVRGLARDDGFADMIRRNMEDREALKEERKNAQAMSLIAAGLGIAGGTSPYFATNVGQGAMAGVKEWNESTKELRRAERDIRNAENAITIAQANRDERQLEKATTLYARAQENYQRSLDRQSREGISSADRAENRRLQEMRIKEDIRLREQTQEENMITHLGTQAQRAQNTAATQASKLAAIKDEIASTPEQQQAKAARIAEAQAQIQQAEEQYRRFSAMQANAINERLIRQGKLTRVHSVSELGDMIKSGKLKKGDNVLMPNGTIAPVK